VGRIVEQEPDEYRSVRTRCSCNCTKLMGEVGICMLLETVHEHLGRIDTHETSTASRTPDNQL
jgi:hypothetical protein